MSNLSKLREEIDAIDNQLLSLYKKRMQISALVAEDKIESGKTVHDPEREKEKLASLSEGAGSDFEVHAIKGLFAHIMAVSRKLQYRILTEKGNGGQVSFKAVDSLDLKKVRVVFQGAEGAYSEAAMKAYFGGDVDSFHVESFKDAMIAINEKRADFAVLPLENSTAGYVSEVFDLLMQFDNYIVAEQELLIEHCLLGLPGSRIEDIRTVYSHPMSLLQAAEYLDGFSNWRKVACENNAFAARIVAEGGDISKAAVAGKKAAQVYGLKILEAGINQSNTNTTRFIIIGSERVYRSDANKISICFEVPHQSGSLYHMLSHFIYNNLNMSRIESRPIPERDWEYRFFVDFEGNLGDGAVRNALTGLRSEAVNLKVLGNY